MLPPDFHLEKRFYYNRLNKSEKELYKFWLEALLDGHRKIAYRLYRDFNPFDDNPDPTIPGFFLEEHEDEINFMQVFDYMIFDCPELYFVYHYVPNFELTGHLCLGGEQGDFSPEEIAEYNKQLDDILHRFDGIDDPFELDLLGYPVITVNESGSALCKPNFDELLEEATAVYDRYYEDLEEAYLNT